MTISVQGPGGISIDFPDGTDHATIDTAMRKATGTAPLSTPSAAEATARGTAQGLTLGWYDKARAAADVGGAQDQPMSLGSLVKGIFSDSPEAEATYTKSLERERGISEADRAAHPYLYLGGEALGSIPTVMGGGALARAIPGAGKIAQGARAVLSGEAGEGANIAAKAAARAASGAGYGAVAGAGEADPGQIIQGALGGAAMGAVLAPAVGASADALRWLGGHALTALNPSREISRAATEAATADTPKGTDVVTYLRDQADRMAEARARGQDLTLADTGPNLRAKAGSVARLESPAKAEAQRFLEDRQLGPDPLAIPSQTAPPEGVSPPGSSQGQRIEDALTNLVGGDTRGTLAAGDQLIATQKANAAPAYEAAYAKDLSSQALTELVPVLQRLDNVGVVKGPGGLYDRLGSLRDPQNVGNVERMDILKQALDAKITTAKRVGDNSLVKNLMGLHDDLASILDKNVPEYATARQTYAGDRALTEALDAGKAAFGTGVDREQIAREWSGLNTNSEKQLYRLGFANAAKASVENMPEGADKANALIKTPNLRNKLGVIAPDQAGRDEFFNALRNERDMFKTAAQLGGSPTAVRSAEDAQVMRHVTETPHVIASLFNMDPRPLLGMAARQMAKVDPAARNAVLQGIHELVLNPDPERIRAFADQISKTQMAEGTRQRVISFVRTILNATQRGVNINAQRPLERGG